MVSLVPQYDKTISLIAFAHYRLRESKREMNDLIMQSGRNVASTCKFLS